MANYPYNYSNYNYNPLQDLQAMRENIDKTMRQYQQQNQNMPQQQIPQINQNFQITPMQQQNELQAKYVNNIDDVKNTFVMREGLFINKDMNTLWIKNINGDIKSYSLTEIIEIDPKDTEIANLKNEIANMRTLLNQQITQKKVDNQPEIVTTTKTEKKSK